MLTGEWNGARIAVASSPDGPCAGLDASPAESLSEAQEPAWWTTAAAGLRQAVPSLARLTLAVPEAWLTSGAIGAARLEAARIALTGLARLHFGVIGRPAAVAAHHEHTSPSRPDTRWLVVVHLGAGDVHATMCHITGAAVAVRASYAQPLPGSSLRASLLAEEDDAEDLQRRVRHGRERLRVALAAASRNPAFLGVPVVGPSGAPPDRWLTARQVRDLLAGWSQALRSAVHGLAGPVADADLPAAVTVLVTGPDRDDILAHEVLLDAVAEWAPAPEAVLAVAPTSAAAEGAALVAAGQATVEATPSRAFSLLVHRISGGRAVSQSLPLTGPADAGPLVAGEAACPVCLDVSGPQGTARLTVTGTEPLPAGRYRAGLWPGWGGATLVLRPADGGVARLYPLLLDGVGQVKTSESE